MTADELIKELKKYPPKTEVFFKDLGTDQEGYESVDRVVLKQDWEGHEDFIALS